MKNTLSILLFFSALTSWSQENLLTIEDAITGYHLYPKGLYDLQWMPGGESFSQVRMHEGESFIEVQEIQIPKGRTIKITLNDVNISLPDSLKLKRLPRAQWISKREFQFIIGQRVYRYNIDLKTSNILPFSLSNRVSNALLFSDASGYMAHVKNGLAYGVKGNNHAITSDIDGIVIGESVHRSEFGITDGLFPSPKYRKLAYYEMDERMVTKYPLYELSDTPATANMLRYPTAGAKSHHVVVKVKNMYDGSDPITIKTIGDKEQYLTNISWTPDEKYLLIAIVNRAQNHMWLNKYDATSGEFIKTLFEEENDRYVEPEHPAIFLKNDPSKFLWWSERDGYNHLYLYSEEGKLLKQVTKGNWVVTDFHGVSEDSKYFFITATKDSPLERHLYKVNLKNCKMSKLTNGAGCHFIVANENNTFFIDNFSSITNPREVRLIDANGSINEVLHKADNPLKGYKLGEMEIGKLKGKSGDDLYYRVFKPIDFDANKKYPVVVYLYNGPHLQLITNRWMGGANLWYQYMAQKGYVLFSIDGRGSADRGFEFESSIFRNCGENEMIDQLTGVNWLKAQTWVDSNRLGIHGWSYGGFMTTSMMSRHPGVFKVGVAGGPVIDWSLYEVMYTERYMDTPEENPEGYAKTNLINHLDSLQGKLLMIHGGLDDVVLWQHSLKYIESAIRKGVQLDYFVYPHHKHNVRGKDRVHLYEKVSNYFFDNL
jgi:dipeptidyl-peptidase-4